MKKPKTTRDVAVMDVSQPSLGVRTRSKTLALQRSATDYLELRSRRLEKPPLSRKSPPAAKQVVLVVCGVKESPIIESSSPQKSEFSGSGFPMERRSEGFEIGDFEVEASFGENNLELDAKESRSTRESTPCSLIRSSENITPHGSSTKQRNYPFEMAQNELLKNIPTAREMEEFFADAELPQQHQFIEKYNFDIVNDTPLPGRFEWVKVMP